MASSRKTGRRLSDGAHAHPGRAPAALLEKDREKVQKTLALAEKYCIISKVARQAMPLEVQIEPV